MPGCIVRSSELPELEEPLMKGKSYSPVDPNDPPSCFGANVRALTVRIRRIRFRWVLIILIVYYTPKPYSNYLGPYFRGFDLPDAWGCSARLAGSDEFSSESYRLRFGRLITGFRATV